MTMSLQERWPILANWRFFVTIIFPFLLCPLLFIEDDDLVNSGMPTERPATKFKCGYVIILMAVYWMIEAIPLAVTALLPIVLFPLFGVQDTSKVSINYMKETNMMFVGGLIIALSVEYCNLHQRVALRVMTLVGSSPKRLMLGIMMTTMFLSMWISNTATTAMMVPIVLAVLDELQKDSASQTSNKNEKRISTASRKKKGGIDEENNIDGLGQGSTKTDYDENDGSLGVVMSQDEESNSSGNAVLRRQLIYGVMCAANIGGVFWPYTSPTSNVLYRLSKRFCTGMILSVAYASNIGGTGFLTGSGPNIILKSITQDDKRRISLEKMYLFAVAYSSNIGGTGVITGSAPNLILQEALKLQPREEEVSFETNGPSTTLLDWKYVQDNLPWGIVLLMGGGFALSDAAEVSGLSRWVGDQLNGLQSLDEKGILIIVMLMTAFITEIASNTACANVIIPILLSLSRNLNLHPLYLTLPATVTCSYAFMLPVATPPNAIVFGAGKHMKILDMVKTGVFLNFSCVLVLFLLNITYGNILFDYSNYVYTDVSNITRYN